MRYWLNNNSSLVLDAELAIIAKAADIQFRRDFAPAWRLNPNDFNIAVNSCDGVEIKISDDPPESGIEGYHYIDEKTGYPVIEIFAAPLLRNGCKVLDGDNSLASVITHEICENEEDSFTNEWSDTQLLLIDDKEQVWSEVSHEMCDPVEDISYVIEIDGHKVTVSNFVLPAWFNAFLKNAKRDFLGVLDFEKPFSRTEGGYVIVRNSAGDENEIFGAKYPAFKLAKKRRPGSRSWRRLNRDAMAAKIAIDSAVNSRSDETPSLKGPTDA